MPHKLTHIEQTEAFNGARLWLANKDVPANRLAELVFEADQNLLLILTGKPGNDVLERFSKHPISLITIGKEAKSTARLLSAASSIHFDDFNELYTFDRSELNNQDVLIFRTENSRPLENYFSAKTHVTRLEIDLNKMAHNIRTLRNQLKADTKLMVMVKAFAYGSGPAPVAKFLEKQKADWLAVAYADEGVALRKRGITMPIMVLNPLIESYYAMLSHQLEPQIYNFRGLEHFLSQVTSMESKTPCPIHIKINTGMNRLGFNLDEMEKLTALLSGNEKVKVQSAFSHLAGSDDPDFDARTSSQIEICEQAIGKLQDALGYPFHHHILNSAGIFRHSGAQMDLVRPGLSLYGLVSAPAFRKKLKPVSSLKTEICQLRTVPVGEGVGYNPMADLKRESQIAVLPLGYADGIPRLLGNGNGRVWLNGQSAPIAGNICMDMFMTDVTGIDCAEGDEVEIFGENISAYEVAENLNTIGYEVLTNISRRVKRVYIHP